SKFQTTAITGPGVRTFSYVAFHRSPAVIVILYSLYSPCVPPHGNFKLKPGPDFGSPSGDPKQSHVKCARGKNLQTRFFIPPRESEGVSFGFLAPLPRISVAAIAPSPCRVAAPPSLPPSPRSVLAPRRTSLSTPRCHPPLLSMLRHHPPPRPPFQPPSPWRPLAPTQAEWVVFLTTSSPVQTREEGVVPWAFPLPLLYLAR
ncbi:hypothetical protein DFH94DRAFT_807635, partial [Russula ochroleuca]